MTLGFPTIVIPAIKGGDGRSVDQEFSLTDDQISWFSMCAWRGGHLINAIISKSIPKQVQLIYYAFRWGAFYPVH